MGFKVKDHYFKKAKDENYLARSIYKLEEIDNKFKVLRKNDFVLDLGYFPGSWTQYCSKVVGQQGRVIGADIQEINIGLEALGNVKLFEKDVFSINSPEDLGVQQKFSCIVSDMAPKTTGIKGVDQDRSYELVAKIFDVCPVLLENGGNMVAKIFEGPDTIKLVKKWKKHFKKLEYFRPKSVRKNSKEVYIVGLVFEN